MTLFREEIVGDVALDHFAKGEWNPNKGEVVRMAMELQIHRRNTLLSRDFQQARILSEANDPTK